MKLEKNKNLKAFNQYGVDFNSKYYAEISSNDELQELLTSKELKNIPIQILGEGNNILFTKDYEGLIIRPLFKGQKIINENNEYIWIEIGAGENWDEFVHWTVENKYEGIENMVSIPSSIGGAASQNIAAYGQNIMDVIDTIKATSLETGKEEIFGYDDCHFSYRSSIFKTEYKNKYIITSVVFKLKKQSEDLEISYHERQSRFGSLKDELESFAKPPYSIQDVMEAVARLRKKKLPSIDEYGTCGSVFANPMVTKEKYFELSEKISELQSYPVEKLQYTNTEWDKITEKYVKIPAGRILEELGWKGKWIGNVGMYEQHALCLVTNRKATGEEVKKFLDTVKKDVKDHYDIELESEINII